MSELLPFVAIIAIGLLGVVLRRRASLLVRRLLLGACALFMLIFAFTDPTHRYPSLLFAFLGVVFLIRMKPSGEAS